MATAIPAGRQACRLDDRSGFTQADSDGVGSRFLKALTERDFPALASCLAEDTQFRALLPRRVREEFGQADPTRCFQEWFGPPDRVELLDGGTRMIADRLHMAWRFRVHDETGERLIEQQAYATVRDGRIVVLDLLCSGFRQEQPSTRHSAGAADGLSTNAASVLDGGEAGCATLTPLIRAKMRELGAGQILDVVSGEPGAEADIASWSSLTGNPLVTTRREGERVHFYIRKK